MKRRDMLEASKLLVKEKVCRPGEMDTTALMLAVSYINEKRDGETEQSFQEWLDGDMEDGDLGDDDAGEDEDGGPTSGS